MAIRRGSDNPFADGGLENGDELLVKHRAVEVIEQEMRDRKISQADLARACGMPRQHISEILHRRLDRYSIHRINNVLAVFGARIEVRFDLRRPAA